jgi:hypothetical protein
LIEVLRLLADQGRFSYNRTALVYLVGRHRRLVGTITCHEPEDVQLKKLRRLIAGR